MHKLNYIEEKAQYILDSFNNNFSGRIASKKAADKFCEIMVKECSHDKVDFWKAVQKEVDEVSYFGELKIKEKFNQ